MSRRAKDPNPTLSLSHYFGAEIRRRRDQHGMTQQELAARLLHSPDLVRKVESAQRFPSQEFVALCDDVLGGPDVAAAAARAPDVLAPAACCRIE